MAYKLIVADASPSVQKAVQLAFSGANWDIVSFDNGLELQKSIFEIHPDALLVSLTLPGMDGYAVGRFLRKQEEFRDTVLVFLKGSFENFDPQRAEGVDYDEIVTKPFDSAKLSVRMKNLVDAKGEHSHFPESPIPDEELKKTKSAPTPQAPPTPTEPLPPSPVRVTPSEPLPASAPAPNLGATQAMQLSAILKAKTPDELEQRLKDWLRRELVPMEREVEKRVRSQVALELKKWFAEHYISLPSKGK